MKINQSKLSFGEIFESKMFLLPSDNNCKYKKIQTVKNVKPKPDNPDDFFNAINMITGELAYLPSDEPIFAIMDYHAITIDFHEALDLKKLILNPRDENGLAQLHQIANLLETV